MISQFWFHGLRNCFITVADCDLFLPLSLTKRLVNHTRPSDITEGYAADWSIDSCRRTGLGIPGYFGTFRQDGRGTPVASERPRGGKARACCRSQIRREGFAERTCAEADHARQQGLDHEEVVVTQKEQPAQGIAAPRTRIRTMRWTSSTPPPIRRRRCQTSGSGTSRPSCGRDTGSNRGRRQVSTRGHGRASESSYRGSSSAMSLAEAATSRAMDSAMSSAPAPLEPAEWFEVTEVFEGVEARDIEAFMRCRNGIATRQGFDF